MNFADLLAKLSATYDTPSVKEGTVVLPGTKAPKAPKAKKEKINKGKPMVGSVAEQEANAPTAEAKPGPTIDLPPVGSIDAPGFMMAMRRATDQPQKVKVIHGYCGYLMGQPYGPQESAAYDKARKELKPIKVDPSEPFKATIRPIDPSVAGFIAGMPDGHQKKLADLLAREKTTAEAIGEFQVKCDNKELPGEVREEARMLMQLETGRLFQIRQDIANLAWQK